MPSIGDVCGKGVVSNGGLNNLVGENRVREIERESDERRIEGSERGERPEKVQESESKYEKG